MYLVSLLIPVYRVESYIERCSRSLFEQTYSDLEYIFVDDCSPDNGVGILESVLNDYPSRKPAVKIIHHKSNKGLASARNTLLDNANGEFVCFVDSDDWLELHAIECLVKQQIDTGSDIVSGNAYMYTENGIQKLYEPTYHDKEEMVLQQFKYTWDHVLWKRLIRRSLYTDFHIKCLVGCDMAEDRYQMALLSYCAQSFSQVDSFIYNYDRRNDNSIMSQYNSIERAYEYLGNWMGIYRFFSDKEEIYHVESAKQAIFYAIGYMKQALKLGSKRDFYHAVESINQIDNLFWSIVGWKGEGLKGHLLRNYWYMRTVAFIERICRYIDRRISICI